MQWRYLSATFFQAQGTVVTQMTKRWDDMASTKPYLCNIDEAFRRFLQEENIAPGQVYTALWGMRGNLTVYYREQLR